MLRSLCRLDEADARPRFQDRDGAFRYRRGLNPLNAAMSLVGLVSRVTPVQTAMRNCARDEGRSFEVDNQVLILSHRKLLSSKAMVVNVAEKSKQDFGGYD